ncbi:hypothetical protein CR194_12755 [Salipaludibacillus keqinensis]|uniref:Uncharacterized protein n=1 Tax=Salipaludibacillus keqinensis TaxID=2045207 RepID=A0A323TEN4_9BACI|nr:hypothetical protein [Salipaludibacillus keqinensis]PYZ92534.1 hypothetical protein CR194_12755 [Salipaludibacillus keqinensis]
MNKQDSSQKRQKKRAKLLRTLLPILFFFAVFLFMVAFKHEDELSNAERRAMELVTFEEEWAVHGHLPEELVEATAGLVPPVKSRMIHRIMEEIPLHIVHLPSNDMAEHTGVESITGAPNDRPQFLTTVDERYSIGWFPTWMIELAHELDTAYNRKDLAELTVLHPTEALRIMNETLEGEEDRRTAQEEERRAMIESGKRPSFIEEEETIPVYQDVAAAIRTQHPDVLLLDFEAIVEHTQTEEFRIFEGGSVGVEDIIDQTYEFLETLYRPQDRFTTYLLFSEDMYDHLGFGPTDQLTDQLQLLAEQNEFVYFIPVSSYEESEQPYWEKEDILPLFYSGA